MERGADWWAQASALTVAPGTADPAAHASRCEDVARRLVQLAGALTLAQTLPGACACGPVGCAFAGIPGGPEACALIPRLAVAAVPPSCAEQLPQSIDALRATYLRTLREAAAAVSHCRRTQHVSGRCWFASSGTGEDVCGQVLVVAHLLSEPDRRAWA